MVDGKNFYDKPVKKLYMTSVNLNVNVKEKSNCLGSDHTSRGFQGRPKNYTNRFK